MKPRIPNRATGLGRALPTGSLLAITTGMTLLAGLALATAIAGGSQASVWAQETGDHLMLELPGDLNVAPTAPATRLQNELLHLDGVRAVHILPPENVAALLRPWLGDASRSQTAFLPVVLDITQTPDAPETLRDKIHTIVPDATIAEDRPWAERLQRLATGVRLLSLVLVTLVAAIAAIVVAIAVRASLIAKHRQIEIVHELGAPPGSIVRPIARACLSLGFTGGVLGAAGAGCVLLGLEALAAPLLGGTAAQPATLPIGLMEWLALLPVLSALLAWAMAHLVVRTWLRRLP